MTLLTTASRRAKRAEQPHFFMPTRLSGEENNKSIRLIWWAGLLLCLIIGAIANYCWHYRYDAPRIRQVEVPHPTVLPYQILPQNVEFTTEGLPEVTAELKSLAETTLVTEAVAAKTVNPAAIEKNDANRTLERRFLLASKEFSELNSSHNPPALVNATSDVIALDLLPLNIRQQIPIMTYSAHVYSSISVERMININGRNYHEEDVVTNKIKLLKIEPNESVFSLGKQQFSLNALKNWDGERSS